MVQIPWRKIIASSTINNIRNLRNNIHMNNKIYKRKTFFQNN